MEHPKWRHIGKRILDQFSRQALPFSAAAMIGDKGALKRTPTISDEINQATDK